jgi:prepilin-type N-terminal cleavage/methylation domain-containing protein
MVGPEPEDIKITMKRGFTLLELLVVLIIIGVLSTLGITHYGGVREQALDREAVANVLLIMSAERIYRMEDDNQLWYYSNDVGQLNTNLKLSLSPGNWNYNTVNAAGVFCVEAQRNGSDGRFWHMFFGQQNASRGSCIPS